MHGWSVYMVEFGFRLRNKYGINAPLLHTEANIFSSKVRGQSPKQEEKWIEGEGLAIILSIMWIKSFCRDQYRKLTFLLLTNNSQAESQCCC